MNESDWWKAHAWTDQRTPALAIVARGDQIRTLGPTSYSVRSQSRPESAYTVTEVSGRWSCECVFFRATLMTCIHIVAVRYKNGFEKSASSVGEVVCHDLLMRGPTCRDGRPIDPPSKYLRTAHA